MVVKKSADTTNKNNYAMYKYMIFFLKKFNKLNVS